MIWRVQQAVCFQDITLCWLLELWYVVVLLLGLQERPSDYTKYNIENKYNF